MVADGTVEVGGGIVGDQIERQLGQFIDCRSCLCR